MDLTLEDLLVDRRDGVLYVTLNRPESRNALSDSIISGLRQVCDYVHAESGGLRALVLRGAGGVFCAGGDIKGFRSQFIEGTADAAAIAAANRGYGALLDTLDRLPLTVITAIDGAAMGGGVGLVAIADVAIATADSRFSLTETTLGLPPAQIAPFVTARIGGHRSRRLMLTAARFAGEEAEQFGLIDEVVTDTAALDDAVERVIRDVRRCAPGANARTKELVHASGSLPLTDLLDLSAQCFGEAMLGAEAREGVAAFLARRKPDWATSQHVSP